MIKEIPVLNIVSIVKKSININIIINVISLVSNNKRKIILLMFISNIKK